MNAATLVWFGAAGLGLGALVAAFPAQLRIVAIAGGAYVAWLGARSLWSACKGDAGAAGATSGAAKDALDRTFGGAAFGGAASARAKEAGAKAGSASAFRDGFAVQLANPKLVVFFTAVLPPFIDPARPVPVQLALLGATMIAIDVASMSLYGVTGGALATALSDARARRAFAALVGALLLVASALILLRD